MKSWGGGRSHGGRRTVRDGLQGGGGGVDGGWGGEGWRVLAFETLAVAQGLEGLLGEVALGFGADDDDHLAGRVILHIGGFGRPTITRPEVGKVGDEFRAGETFGQQIADEVKTAVGVGRIQRGFRIHFQLGGEAVAVEFEPPAKGRGFSFELQVHGAENFTGMHLVKFQEDAKFRDGVRDGAVHNQPAGGLNDIEIAAITVAELGDDLLEGDTAPIHVGEDDFRVGPFFIFPRGGRQGQAGGGVDLVTGIGGLSETRGG